MVFGTKALGFILLLAVVVLWVASSTIIQVLFVEVEYFKPFFLTWFSTSMFSFYLLSLIWKKREFSEVKEIAKTAAPFCIFWFGANYLFNLSLGMTTISSNTILSSTSGVITLVLAVIFLKETPDILKFLAAMLAFGGVSCIALADKDEGRESLIGDFLAFAGAIVYGCYCVLLKKKADKVDMVMFFGCVGILNAFLFSPFFLLLHFTGFETFELPGQLEISVLILNGIFGTVISDLLWALSVRYLNPALCTIGLSLTIPLSLATDNIMYHKVFDGLYFGGGVLILAGFIIMSLFEHKTISTRISNKGLRKLCNEKEDDKELLEV